jgi:hypothetical protein
MLIHRPVEGPSSSALMRRRTSRTRYGFCRRAVTSARVAKLLHLGIHVCGGRGAHSRRTPLELESIGARVGFDGAALATTSRLVAKVGSAAVQDGFDLYLHGFIVIDDGHWAVVQQGMNGARRQARRYHWLSEGLASFVDAPHPAIAGEPKARSSIWPTGAPSRRAAAS